MATKKFISFIQDNLPQIIEAIDGNRIKMLSNNRKHFSEEKLNEFLNGIALSNYYPNGYDLKPISNKNCISIMNEGENNTYPMMLIIRDKPISPLQDKLYTIPNFEFEGNKIYWDMIGYVM